MHKREVIRRIKVKRERVSESIAMTARHGGMYARGLASEGYEGGYVQALRDVLLLLESDTIPDSTFYFEKELKVFP